MQDAVGKRAADIEVELAVVLAVRAEYQARGMTEPTAASGEEVTQERACRPIVADDRAVGVAPAVGDVEVAVGAEDFAPGAGQVGGVREGVDKGAGRAV